MANKITIEKAIECNKNLRAYMEICDKNSPCKFCEENYIALDMGIEALEQENKVIEMRDTTPEDILNGEKSKIGHWIKGRCSECEKDGLLESTGEYVCDTFIYRVAHSKFCPNCGIRMVESEDKNE